MRHVCVCGRVPLALRESTLDSVSLSVYGFKGYQNYPLLCVCVDARARARRAPGLPRARRLPGPARDAVCVVCVPPRPPGSRAREGAGTLRVRARRGDARDARARAGGGGRGGGRARGGGGGRDECPAGAACARVRAHVRAAPAGLCGVASGECARARRSLFLARHAIYMRHHIYCSVRSSTSSRGGAS